MNQILQQCSKAENIGIAGHIRPDGDCIGACMAMYLYLKKEYPDKNIDVYLECVPETFKFLKKAEEIKVNYVENVVYDLFIALDNGDQKRLGKMEPYFENAKNTICIDHHISNTKYADINHLDNKASSTCEILFELFEEEKIDTNIAEALYLGIVHDTGVFKHSNTSERTMQIAGKLMSKGVAFSRMIDESFYQKTYIQTQILGRCLLESILVMDGKCIVSYLSKKMLDFYGADSDDLEGIIDQLRVTKGVEVAILVYETNVQEYKVSMRSNEKVDVSKIAVYFSGGGHIRAAGCTMNGSIHDVINNITEHIEAQLVTKKE